MTPDFSARTVGILGGMGPAASVNFQQLLVTELNNSGARTDGVFPRIISLSLPLKDWDHLGAQNKTTVATQVRQGVNWLDSHGADIIAIPCNTVHEFVDNSKVINIIDEVLKASSYAQTLGILCSRQTRDSKLYERQDRKYVYSKEQSDVDNIISRVLAGQRPNIYPFITSLLASGADVVVLGCTELSLCAKEDTFGIVLDSSRVLAEAVVKRLESLASQ